MCRDDLDGLIGGEPGLGERFMTEEWDAHSHENHDHEHEARASASKRDATRGCARVHRGRVDAERPPIDSRPDCPPSSRLDTEVSSLSRHASCDSRASGPTSTRVRGQAFGAGVTYRLRRPCHSRWRSHVTSGMRPPDDCGRRGHPADRG